MAMTTKVVGIVPPDETWKKMKAIWDSCEAAGIECPDEVFEYFDEQDPDPKGMIVEIPSKASGRETEEWREVVLADIPEKVKTIRFVNSW